MTSEQAVTRLSKSILVSGFVLDGVNKLSNYWKVLPPKLLGTDNPIANNIGNFGTAAILTSVVRNKILDNMVVFDRLVEKRGDEYAEKIKNALAFTSVALLYVAWEGIIHPLAKGSNPEMINDIAIAFLSSTSYLNSYPKHREKIFF